MEETECLERGQQTAVLTPAERMTYMSWPAVRNFTFTDS